MKFVNLYNLFDFGRDEGDNFCYGVLLQKYSQMDLALIEHSFGPFADKCNVKK